MIIVWKCAYRTFGVKRYFKSCESIIATQKAFHVYFLLYQDAAVPVRIFNS